MMDAFFYSVMSIVISLISVYKWVIIIAALLTWVRPDPYNPIIQILDRITLPAYQLIRRLMPTHFFGMDWSPLIIIVLLTFIETFLASLFRL